MKKATEFMNEFMTTLDNMKKYQGIDIANPSTYFDESGIVHEAFSLEKKVISTVKTTEINDNSDALESSPKQLKLTKKNNKL